MCGVYAGSEINDRTKYFESRKKVHGEENPICSDIDAPGRRGYQRGERGLALACLRALSKR
jgi:hypothetical protein